MNRLFSNHSIATRVAACALTSVLPGASACATEAAAPTANAEARIAFANHGGIRDWQADGDNALYVQDLRGRWYHAELMGTCLDLPFSQRVGFVSEPSGEFNRWSSIIVRGQQCMLKSLTASGGPRSGSASSSG